MQQFTAAADRPTHLRFIIRLRKRAQIGDKRDVATADAVVAERVIDAGIGETARSVEQQMVVDYKTGATTQRAEPIYVAFKSGCLGEAASPDFNVELPWATCRGN